MAWDSNQKVYTKTGDKLMTSLPRLPRVSKADKRLQLLGTIDELSSHLGVIRAESDKQEIKAYILKVQQTLIGVMGGIADNFRHSQVLTIEDVEAMERVIDTIEGAYVRENRFYCPGETIKGAHIDVARTVARRAERCMAECVRQIDFPDAVLQYMNRMADFLYVLARFEDSKK